MVDHIYGRGMTLVSDKRPHMFAKEIILYVDYFEKQVKLAVKTGENSRKLEKFKNNLEEGMTYCLEISESKAYKGENLNSIPLIVQEQRIRLQNIFEELLAVQEIVEK